MAEVSLRHIKKVYPNSERTSKKGLFGRKKADDGARKASSLRITDEGVLAVPDFNLDIADREFVVFVGPSGCGKSTTLRMIAGLEEITDGELYIDGKLMNDVAPKDRDIAMVFQSYALYPHMTVRDNLAFPLKLRKMDKQAIDARVNEAAETLGITEFLDRKPKALSGGQRQRVAIGRAIVREPKVLLMDEPLSNLDAKLRNQMRAEIIKLRQRINSTFIYVTHDQTEAMTLGDRIVIMKDGEVQQVGTPQEVFEHPSNLFVAGFIGVPQMNFFDAELVRDGDAYSVRVGDAIVVPSAEKQARLAAHDVTSQSITLGIRPEHISLASGDAATLVGTVDVSEMMGSSVHVHLDSLGQDVIVIVPTTEIEGPYQDHFFAGAKVEYTFASNVIHIFSKDER
ncbi:MAG: sn-glycerol-3-phosphate ABC transporter ATP-binding protein UgpC, partial [Atopobiaceae bacterium]|nr:sn-glycerol-3-phosphate ABC transporter ATP-binding protein UgpC [Atopobiaceae bacterium]